MAIQKITVEKHRNYYYSTINPVKIFGTEAAARNYESQFTLETMNYFTFYDIEGNEINWEYTYETDVEWRMEDRKLVEIETHSPEFYIVQTNNGNTTRRKVSFFYIYNRAYYMEIHSDPDDKSDYTQRLRRMNKDIRILRTKWKIDIPSSKGYYKYSKMKGWSSCRKTDIPVPNP